MFMVTVVLVACESGSTAEEHFQRATDFHAQGDLGAASIELKNALRIDSDLPEARWLLAQIHLSLGNGQAALKEIERAKSLGRSGPDIEIARLRSLLLQQSFAQVLTELDDWEMPGHTNSVSSLRGEAQLGLRQPDAARTSFMQALADSPDDADARLGLSRVALMEGNVDEAEKQLELALEADEQKFEAWYRKAELALDQSRLVEARSAYEKAIEISPGRPGPRTGLARALLGLGDLDAAEEQIKETARLLAPKSPEVNYLKALLAAQREQLDEAKAALHTTLSVSPSHPAALFLLGRIHVAQNELEQAREVFTRLLSVSPGHLPATKLLAAVHLHFGASAEALRWLEPMAKRGANDPGLHVLLGRAYMRSRRFDEATRHFQAAARLSPNAAQVRTELALSQLAGGDKDSGVAELVRLSESEQRLPETRVLLMLTYVMNKDFANALATGEAVLQTQPDNPLVHNLLGATYEATGDREKARISYEKALELSPTYQVAAMELARLNLREGDIEAARTGYAEVLEQEPENWQALFGLAAVERGAGRVGRQIELLERARQAESTALLPRLQLAELYLRRGPNNRALAVSKEAHQIAPTHQRALVTLGRAHLAVGDVNEAVRVLETSVRRYPGAPSGHLYLGMALRSAGRLSEALDTLVGLTSLQPSSTYAHLQLGRTRAQSGDMEGALESFARALQLDTDYLPAKSALARVYLDTGRWSDALALAGRIQTEHPESGEGWALQGDALFAGDEAQKAVSAYEVAMQHTPTTALALKAFQAKRVSGDTEAGYGFLQDWLQQRPGDVPARNMLASAYHQDGRSADAIEQFRLLLEQHPGSVLALNNLAWLHYEQGDPSALSFAEQAFELAPDQAQVIDTYGWLLVSNGQIQRGRALIEKALQIAPEDPSIRYHLAVSLVKAGALNAARSELEALLSSDASFAEREKAQAILNELR